MSLQIALPVKNRFPSFCSKGKGLVLIACFLYVAEKANQTSLGEEMGEQEYSDIPLALWQS